MAHVLIASPDEHVRDALAAPLRTAGHSVMTTSDGALALAALWSAEEPLVTLLDERFAPMAASAILDRDGSALLARHSYALITILPENAGNLTACAVALDAAILPLPHSPWSLLATVHAADNDLRQRAGAWPLAPRSWGASAVTGSPIIPSALI